MQVLCWNQRTPIAALVYEDLVKFVVLIFTCTVRIPCDPTSHQGHPRARCSQLIIWTVYVHSGYEASFQLQPPLNSMTVQPSLSCSSLANDYRWGRKSHCQPGKTAALLRHRSSAHQPTFSNSCGNESTEITKQKPVENKSRETFTTVIQIYTANLMRCLNHQIRIPIRTWAGQQGLKITLQVAHDYNQLASSCSCTPKFHVLREQPDLR